MKDFIWLGRAIMDYNKILFVELLGDLSDDEGYYEIIIKFDGQGREITHGSYTTKKEALQALKEIYEVLIMKGLKDNYES